MQVDIDFLHECFLYDPGTGVLTWRERPIEHFKTEPAWRTWNTKYAGKEAGHHKSSRYRKLTLTVLGRKNAFLAHKIIWALHTGAWPKDFLDHKDRDVCANTIDNLREATHRENMRNRRPRCPNKTGYRGVYELPSGRFIAKLKTEHVRLYLGVHDTKEEAYAAYCVAALQHFGEFACLT